MDCWQDVSYPRLSKEHQPNIKRSNASKLAGPTIRSRVIVAANHDCEFSSMIAKKWPQAAAAHASRRQKCFAAVGRFQLRRVAGNT